MSNFGRLHNLFIVAGLLLAAVAIAKLLPWFLTDIGLLCILSVSCIVTVWRYKVLKRQKTPETRGNIKKLQATDVQRMKPWLFKNIVGQGPSVHAIMQILKRNAEMLDSNRHLGSYLLVGPTGTGKTFFAQLLSEGLYGRGSLLSIPMNQDGLKGEKVIEILLTSLKKNPNRVILLDEIDKASSSVQSTLYHFMESGQIMDPDTGEWFHCPGIVIIATTNAGSQSDEAAVEAGKSHYGLLDHVAAHSNMEKAFLARFDGLYWFGKLSPMDICHIGIMQVMSYYKQHGVEVSYLCPEAIVDIIKENQRFREFGVRQLIQVVRHKSDPIISQAKNNGWREVEIITDQKGTFIPQITKKKRTAA